MASIYTAFDDVTGTLTSPAEKKMEGLPKAEACGSPCVQLTTLENGVKGVCMYYIAKGVLVVVMPIVFSLNMGGLPGGVDGRHESACQFLKACPTFDNQREMWETMRDPAKCEEAGGIHLEVPESPNDHSMGDTEIWFSIRCLTIVFAAIGAGLNLRSMMSGSNAYLAPLVRGLIVLCLCEMFAEVFAHMSIDDMCSDDTVRQDLRCAMGSETSAASTGSAQEINTATPAMQCEELREKHDLFLFALGVVSNCYFCWIVHSYESSVRAGSSLTAGISDDSPA